MKICHSDEQALKERERSVKGMDNTINVDNVDKAAHRIWDFHRRLILDSNTPIYGEWKVFYHKERLYSVYNIKRHIISLVFANSMLEAVSRVKNAWKERENNG